MDQADAVHPDLHAELKTFRDQVYAHTDASGGREADVGHVTSKEEDPVLAFREQWVELPKHWLPQIIDAATRQRDRFRAEGLALAFPQDHGQSTNPNRPG